MKTWIGIGVVIGFSLIAGLGTILFRNLDADYQAGAQGIVISGALAERGLQVANTQGCVACHTLDGSAGIGPTWLGMYGRIETFKDGSSQEADADYIRESILQPGAKIVDGFENIMLQYLLPESDIEALVEFSRQLSQTPDVTESE